MGTEATRDPVAVSDESLELPLDDGRDTRTAWLYRLAEVALGLVLLGLWEILPRTGLVSDIILPPFSEVASALFTLVQQDFFWTNLWTTLTEILVGFVLGSLIGFVLGVALAIWLPFKRLVYPYVVAFQAVPKIVFAPVFIAWFGFGQTSKIVMAIVIAFFPVLINTMIGLQSVPSDALRLMRSLRATRLQTFWKVSLPHSLPVISAGVKTALTFAVIGAIVAEFVGASEGLGYLLDLYNFQLAIDRVFAVIVVLSVIGAAGFFLLEWIDRKLIFWQTDDE